KWLVGSSNNKTSGSCNNNRHNATLLRSPPDKLAMSASGSGQRNASIARSSFASNSQAVVASIISCNSPCLANNLSIASTSSYTSGNPNFSLISSYSSRIAVVSATPSSSTCFTVLVRSSSGSCARYPTEYPGENTTSPWYDLSIPAIIFNKDDFPEPFKPITPILAP